MKNSKGFTLIELLAVIVILAIIMVIAVPKILDVIESSKRSAARSSIELVKDAIKTQVNTGSLSGTTFEKTGDCYEFNFADQESGNAKKLALKNKEKIGGSIKYCNGKFEEDTLTFDGERLAKPVAYYAFGDPTTSSTTDYTTLGKNVFVKLEGEQKSVCIVRNNKLECFKNNNVEEEQSHVQEVFSDISCNDYSFCVSCDAPDMGCSVHLDGFVDCSDLSASNRCTVDGNGLVNCS